MPSRLLFVAVFAAAIGAVVARGLTCFPFRDGVLAGRITAGGGDILDLESAEFNERFRIMSDDARYAHAVLTPRMMERLLRDDAKGFAIAIDGDRVLTWRLASRSSARHIDKRLGVLADVAALILSHVVSTYGKKGYPGAFTPGKEKTTKELRRKNWLAVAAVLTAGLAPVSRAFAHASIRASQRGEADNVFTARFVAAYEWGFLAVVIGIVIGVLGGYALGFIEPTDITG